MAADNAISPWDSSAERSSPDGMVTVQFTDGFEVGMGAPTMGTLWLCSDGKRQKLSDRAAASFCISTDSEYLAYCEWTERMKQVIKVVKINGMSCNTIDEELCIVRLEAFEKSVLIGTDSPAYHPRKFRIDIADMF